MNKRRYFNDLASRWDSLPTAPDAWQRTACFVDKMRVSDDGRVLDVGCGTGILVEHLTRVLRPTARLVELDLAERMLRESLRAHPDARVSGLCADARCLPLPSDSFDAVLCFGVLPHLGEPEVVTAELLRVLHSGGTLGVGHLMDSQELNAFHAGLGPPVAGDHLPPASVLGEILRRAGAVSVVTEERAGWYFVRAVKGGR
jgi:demethylmenaquinone methyltransferase/2-methoxy-6-polyprenyl-1,4-benzoquinol methylase